MKKRIRPADEEFGNIWFSILFCLLWYGLLISNLIHSTMNGFGIIFLIAGLLPIYSVVTSIRRALFYRKQRAEAIALGNASYGRITGITRQDIPYTYSGKHGRRIGYRRMYVLQVELLNPSTGIAYTVESQGYRRPIHLLLASDQVKVYTDKTGWKYYLEEFQLKEHRNDPGIFGPPREFEETQWGNGTILRIIMIAVILLTFLRTLLGQ